MNYKIGVIGLGYVGLPLAVSFQKTIKRLDLILIKRSQINKMI